MEIRELQNLIEKHNLEFDLYFKELIEYNKHTNLTAITEQQDVYIKHFLDSILPIDEIKQNSSIVDVGTGAGFPSLPIKIVRPDVKLTMVDSLNKRINFLNLLCGKLAENDKGFKEIKNVHARAEDFCLTNRAKFDVSVARAVAKLNTLLEYLLPLVKVGGIVLAYKGSSYLEELEESKNAINILGGQYVKTLSFNLPNDAGERNIIVIKKVKPTPQEYPRPQNKPKTNPIK